jgi:nucleotide-binding universal stress UspA family protein
VVEARPDYSRPHYTNVNTDFVPGDPAGKILEHAETHQAGLIVIGHRGLTPKATCWAAWSASW